MFTKIRIPEAPDHLSQWVKDRAKQGTPITKEEWSTWRMNTYEREALYPLMDNECLKATVLYFQGNCPLKYGPLPTTYSEALIHTLLPILLARIP